MALYRMTFNGIGPGGDVFNYNLMCESDVGIIAAAAAADAALEAFLGEAEGVFSTATLWSATKVTRVSETAGFPAAETAAGSFTGAGTATGGVLPPQLAWCVSLRTSVPGPRGRGRFFLPTPGNGTFTGQARMPSVAITMAVDGITAMWTSLETDTFSPVVGHRATGTFTGVTSMDLGDVLDTQRRRRSSLEENRTTIPHP